jgi:hypothetical protein
MQAGSESRIVRDRAAHPATCRRSPAEPSPFFCPSTRSRIVAQIQSYEAVVILCGPRITSSTSQHPRKATSDTVQGGPSRR